MLVEWPKHSLWNIECGNAAYVFGLPVNIPLGTVSLAGASVSGVAMLLSKNYQKKLRKVMKLINIVTSVLAVFETSVSKALNDGTIDDE